jgi:hypothetical protein
MNVVLHNNQYLAYGMGLDGSFTVYDTKDRYNPKIIGSFQTGSLYVRNVIISKRFNNYLYLSDDFKGVTILK